MPQKKINGEVMPARLPSGTLKKMDAARKEGESRSEFIRVAIRCLLKRRTDTGPATKGDNDLTVKEASELLALSQSTIYRLGKTGGLALKKIGANTRVTRASIQRLVATAKPVYPKARSPR